MEHRGLAGYASEFTARGLNVVRFNFLYTEKQKGPPDRMPRLIETFAAVVEKTRQELQPRHLFIGGHSMGGRAASMMAAEGFCCDGLILLAYPLHPCRPAREAPRCPPSTDSGPRPLHERHSR